MNKIINCLFFHSAPINGTYINLFTQETFWEPWPGIGRVHWGLVTFSHMNATECFACWAAGKRYRSWLHWLHASCRLPKGIPSGGFQLLLAPQDCRSLTKGPVLGTSLNNFCRTMIFILPMHLTCCGPMKIPGLLHTYIYFQRISLQYPCLKWVVVSFLILQCQFFFFFFKDKF